MRLLAFLRGLGCHHHRRPAEPPLSPGERLILAAIKHLGDTMSKELQDALAQAAEDIKPIVGKLDSLVVFVQSGVPAIVSAAVAKALADAKVEDKAAAKAIKDIVATIKQNVDEIVLPAAEENAPVVDEPTDPDPLPDDMGPGPVTVQTNSISGSVPLSGHLSASGGDGGPYTFAVEGSASDLQVTPDGFYVVNTAGTGSVTVTATDASGAASEPASVSVAATEAA